MKLYQAGYFRRGKQGANAGWNIVSPSEGMSKIAKDGFQGLAANLTELKRRGTMPVTNLGLFLYDRFVYLLHVNYAASGEDARGVTYVHGYCFNLSDYYELCREPSRLCGILDENFQLEYDESVRAYPVKEGFETGKMLDFSALAEKYHLSDEDYRKLMLGALCAIDGGDPLCIKCDLPLEEYKQAYRELLYLIMEGLPFHLRIKVSGFSYSGAKAAVYLSSEREGGNYADLDSHEFSCDTARMDLLQFTELYRMPLAQRAVREKVYEKMADFTDKAFENPLKEAACHQVEAAYQSEIRRNRAGGISPDEAPELLQNFIACNPADSAEAGSYLADLVRLTGERGYEITDKKVKNRLQKFYEKTTDERCRQEMDRYFAMSVVRQGKKGYRTLNELRENGEQFASVCRMIRSQDEDYYVHYYETEYLPGILSDLDKVDAFLSEDQGEFMTPDGYRTALGIFKKLILEKINAVDSFESFQQAEKTASRLLVKFMKRVEAEMGDVLKDAYEKLWERFDLTWFDPEKYEEYRDCKIDSVVQKSRKAAAVADLMRLIRSDFEQNRDFMIDLLLTDEILQDDGEKEALQKTLRREYKKAGNWRDAESLDVMLCLYYDHRSDQFRTPAWCSDCFKKRCEMSVFSPAKVQERVENSSVLRESRWRERFAEDLEMAIREAKKAELDREQVRGLKLYYNCLMGRDIDPRHDSSRKDHFIDSIHRIFIGFCALTAAGAGLYNVYRSAEDSGGLKTGVYVLAIAFLVLWLGAFIAKIFLSGGLGDLMENAGIAPDEPPKAMIYFGTIVVGLIVCALVFFLSRLLGGSGQFIFRMIGLGIFGLLALGSAIIYFVKAEE